MQGPEGKFRRDIGGPDRWNILDAREEDLPVSATADLPQPRENRITTLIPSLIQSAIRDAW
jgi:hypothetical protein